MNQDTRNWLEEAVLACKDAQQKGVSLLLRNDDIEAIVTTATAAPEIRELAMGLACGYYADGGSDGESSE